MGFFKKEVKPEVGKIELPTFPPEDSNNLPMLPELPNLDEPTQKSLPTLPKTQLGNLNIQAIKENIQSQKNEDFEVHKIDNLNEHRTYELDALPPTPKLATTNSSIISDNKPIFVKIDKFKDAAAKFEEIKSRVYEIEASLSKIKQVKEQEEQELKAWEEEIKTVKEKISNIDSSLFNKI